MRNLLVAQSGGPTAAINATVAGVVSCAVLSGKVDHIYGAVNGIEGVLAEKFLDLGKKLDSAEKNLSSDADPGSSAWLLSL